MEFYWCEKRVVFPVRRLCHDLATCLSFRKQGSIMMLSQEVQACEYEDVRIMWEMLQRTDISTRSPSKTYMKNKRLRSVFAWARSLTKAF